MSDSGPILEVRDVHKCYTVAKARLEILRGVSFSVVPGEFVALRGASGAGKSTLLHVCGGLDTVDAGSIHVRGRRLDDMKPAALARFRNRCIGLIFQAYHLLPELTALENVCLPSRMARTGVRESMAKAESLLERAGLKDRMSHRPSQLSGGEQQRVGIARALINDPDLILADEPTGNLDSRTGEEILSLLLDLRRERQMTLVVATHDARIAAHAERTVMLVDGLVSEVTTRPDPAG